MICKSRNFSHTVIQLFRIFNYAKLRVFSSFWIYPDIQTFSKSTLFIKLFFHRISEDNWYCHGSESNIFSSLLDIFHPTLPDISKELFHFVLFSLRIIAIFKITLTKFPRYCLEIFGKQSKMSSLEYKIPSNRIGFIALEKCLVRYSKNLKRKKTIALMTNWFHVKWRLFSLNFVMRIRSM